MTATMTNGSAKSAAAEILATEPGISARELGNRIGVKERQARNIRNAVRTAEVRNVAAGAVPVAATNGRREVSLPARTNKPKTKTPEAADDTAADRWLVWFVAAVVALGSYSHTVDLAIMAGHGWRAYLVPVALDGLAIASIRSWRQKRRRLVAGIGIAVGIVGAAAANALAMRPDLVDLAVVSPVLAVFQPVALAVIVHLVRR